LNSSVLRRPLNVLDKDEELLHVSHKVGGIEWISEFETFSKESLNGAQKKNTNIVEDYFYRELKSKYEDIIRR